MVQVAGYASATSNAAINDKLTDERAQNVIRVPGADRQRAALPGARACRDGFLARRRPTVETRAEKRVVVTIVVNKGVAGNWAELETKREAEEGFVLGRTVKPG
jgi:hypothetical protein